IAHHRNIDPRVVEVREHGAEHPPGDDDHVCAGCADPGDRLARVRVQHGVRADERAVEVDGERRDVPWEAWRELDQRYGGVPPVALTTYDATSAICCVESCPLNDGMTPFPSVTRPVASW